MQVIATPPSRRRARIEHDERREAGARLDDRARTCQPHHAVQEQRIGIREVEVVEAVAQRVGRSVGERLLVVERREALQHRELALDVEVDAGEIADRALRRPDRAVAELVPRRDRRVEVARREPPRILRRYLGTQAVALAGQLLALETQPVPLGHESAHRRERSGRGAQPAAKRRAKTHDLTICRAF
jgi:hypothetical protein